MSTPESNQIRSLDELRRFVHRILCEKENILSDQFGLSESMLVRCGKSCGRQFSVCGPRSIRLNAIWVEDRNMLYFYDARGERFLKLQLAQQILACAV